MTTIQNYLIMLHEVQPAKTLNLVNNAIDTIWHKGLVTHLHSWHLQMLYHFTTIFRTMRQQFHNQLPVHAKDFHVIGHSCKDMTTTKVFIAGLICSPHCSFQGKGRQLNINRECPCNCRKTNQSTSQHLPAQLLHLDLVLVHLEDLPFASHWQGPSCQQNCAK